jgi:hypothetical protein
MGDLEYRALQVSPEMGQIVLGLAPDVSGEEEAVSPSLDLHDEGVIVLLVAPGMHGVEPFVRMQDRNCIPAALYTVAPL